MEACTAADEGTTCQVKELQRCHVGQDQQALAGQALVPREAQVLHLLQPCTIVTTKLLRC